MFVPPVSMPDTYTPGNTSPKSLRIASLLPSATEIVCALGLEDSLVGVTHECDYPLSVATKPKLTASRLSHETMTSREIDDAVRAELRHKQSTALGASGEHDDHASLYTLDDKLLHELKPDLILTQELCDVCAVNFKTVSHAARVFETEIPIVSLEPTTITDILDTIRTVGKLARADAEAESVVQDLAIRIDNLAAKLADVPHRPRVLMLEWLEPPFAPGHWVPEQVALAGGDPSFGAAGAPSARTTPEAIMAYAPEVIVLVPCGYDTNQILHALESAQLPAGWSELPAVQNGQVWAANATAYFSRPGPRVVQGAEILAQVLHPELFGAPDERDAVRVPSELMRARTTSAANTEAHV